MTGPVDDPSQMAAARRIFTSAAAAAAPAAETLVARLGELKLPGRKPMPTPNFTGVASRGVIPHVTPDNLSKYTSIGSAYMALEDFVEKKEPPIYHMPPGDDPVLHRFSAFPSDAVTIMGLRRCPPVAPPVGNRTDVISIYTSTGFHAYTISKYATATASLRPDIAIAPADLPPSGKTPSAKRQYKMTERTENWVDEFLQVLDKQGGSSPVFAPVLPAEHGLQWNYIRHLSEDILDRLSGLAIYDLAILPDLAKYAVAPLPRLSLVPPTTPQDILRQISLGADVTLASFVNSASDAGVALTFTLLPPPSTSSQHLPMGIDMWSTSHQISLEPLVENCQCYACQKHHRAFVQHLLNAKEMLGWTLLQIHNHHILTNFFSDVRTTLSRGGAEALEEARREFEEAYEKELPVGTGQGPRVRGYQFNSMASQEKVNKPAWQDLEKVAAVGPAAVTAETPVVPDEDGERLVEMGFAEQRN